MRLAHLLTLSIAACAPSEGAVPPVVSPPPGEALLPMPEAPVGATLSATGHATIMEAPFDPELVSAVAAPPVGGAEEHWYGRAHGLSVEEAAARLEAQNAMSGKAAALAERLRREEKGNFLDWMLEHDPDWSYVYFFKRDPAKTLAKYTSETRFSARSGAFSQEERKALIAPWNKRWSAEGIPFGYGLDAVYPTMDIELGITAADYRALAKQRGWGTPPPPIVLKFADEPKRPAVDPRVASFLTGFAHEKRHTLMQLQALGIGRLTLENGCLMVAQGDGAKKVAAFHYETGISLDQHGYLVLIDRMDGSVRGRIGEEMAWGAPNAIPEKGMVGIEALRAACPGEVLNIGNPESLARFNGRNPGTGVGTVPPPAPPPPPPPPPPRSD
ncbi:hypothetical protein WJS89_09540 [Sphingomicrobium sp. XHP0235]|uniref:hypothetical protein n=1 Tax=Sphingomicrobium aquimarinum TaxID=3133971 RepID=UPI0031FED579